MGFIEIREGIKVDKITFSIKSKKGVTEQENKTLAEVSLEAELKEKFLTLGFNDDEIFELRKNYTEDRFNEILILFQKNIDDVKSPKPWIEKALKENFIDSTEFKKKFSIEDQNFKKELDEKEKNKNKLLKIFETKFQKTPYLFLLRFK